LYSHFINHAVILNNYDSSVFKSVILFFMALTTCCIASANILSVSANGTFSGSDVSGPLIIPDSAFSLSFAVDDHPTPLGGSVSSLGFDVPVSSFTYMLNGSAVAATPSEIRFSTSANGGLFDVIFGSGLATSEFVFSGAQAFFGTTAAPVFSTGQYAISSWTFSDPVNYDVASPIGAAISITPAPEPSSISLILCGCAGLMALSRHKHGKVA
jgi:hypothetical protein